MELMFEMKPQDFEIWRSQFVTSMSDQRGLRYARRKDIYSMPKIRTSL